VDSKILLAIETSSNICSVAIIKRYKILSVIENNAQKQHVEIMPSYVEQAMDQSKISIDNLDAIALSIGPGSFTGLRIGLGFSKGIAYAKKIPIIPIPSLLSLAFSVKEKKPKKGIMHSHAKKVFYQEFKWHNEIPFIKTEPVVGDIHDFSPKLDGGFQYNCEKITGEKFYLDEAIPSAVSIGLLGTTFFDDWAIEDTFRMVPDYIAPFAVGSHAK